MRLFKKLAAIFLSAAVMFSAFPAAGMHAAAADAEAFCYLEDAGILSATTGWGSVGYGKTTNGTTMELFDKENGGNRQFSHGIGVHAHSEIVVNLEDCGYSAFETYLGVDVNGDSKWLDRGSVNFKIYLDDTLAYQSGTLKVGDGMRAVSIPLGEHKRLKLVADPDGSNAADWADWADARLILDPAKQNNLKSVQLSIDQPLLPVGDALETTLRAVRINGSEVDLTKEGDVTYRSSNDAVASVDENGRVTGLADGIADITASVSLDGIVKESSAAVIVGTGATDHSWPTLSPDGSNMILFVQNGNGSVDYFVSRNGKSVVSASPTGLITSLGDFTSGLTFVSADTSEIYEEYDMTAGKQSHVVNHANETTLHFEKDGVAFSIVSRAYDDGVAFRYIITGKDGEKMVIDSEETGFAVPDGSMTYAQPYSTDDYEASYTQQDISAVKGNYGWTFLYRTPSDVWALLAEAEHTPQYAGIMLQSTGDGMLSTGYTPQVGSKRPETAAPFVSPWRSMMLGDLETIAKSMLVENLSAPCQIEDTSWIKPGISGWTWLNGDSTSSPDVYKRYIDLAAEMGWEYITMDDGWSAGGRTSVEFPDWMDDLMNYANERGVGLFAWLPKDVVNTPEKQEDVFSRLSAKGIKGVKIDWFGGESQSILTMYDQIMRSTAKHHLLVNLHGANLPTGERRTWPHVLTREAVRGEECRNPQAAQNTILPFTRNVVGGMDYTPLCTGYSLSDAHHAAMGILFESAVQTLAGKPAQYRASAAYDLYRNLPAAWDQMEVLEAELGSHTTIARRSGADWYIGGISADARSSSVPLTFLDDETYYAYIYQDGKDNRSIDFRIQKVTREDSLPVSICQSGGFAVKLTKTPPTQAESIQLDKTQLTLEEGSSDLITAVLSPSDVDLTTVTWSSSDDSVASVSGGQVKGLKPGKAVITAATGIDGTITAQCSVTVIGKTFTMKEGWSIIREDPDFWELNGTNRLTIRTQQGDLYGSAKSTKNLMVTPAGAGEDFTVTTKLSFAPTQHCQSAGIMVYANDEEAFVLFRRYHRSLLSGQPNVIATLNKRSSSYSGEQAIADPAIGEDIYLKIEKQGNSLSGYVSTDSQNWTLVKSTVTNDALASADVKVGLYVGTGSSVVDSIPAVFTDFAVNGTVVPFADYTEGFNTDLEMQDGFLFTSPQSADLLKEQFTQFGEIVVKDSSGSILDGDKVASTGCTVELVYQGAVSASAAIVVKGDVDGDGKKSVLDLITIKQYILRSQTPNRAAFLAADYDGSGRIDIFDLLHVKLDILNGGTFD
ncbi:glycoside hydrolase family 97 catalytic domain-containing protein [Candidatus Soleaferrea massiliensis]|uniref:glycoside hydrolase family 97 catalytic domain-containing protein n=1 Tax=Candidatus Soleaferrea massiliensis TaxID=1470354 RepID=UPI00058C9A5E|nr:glycoside hydrolase family 97 catalytic domain-containing protein [Candidatus Soleaferrea massiliensis]